jgi:hypothetical protein
LTALMISTTNGHDESSALQQVRSSHGNALSS